MLFCRGCSIAVMTLWVIGEASPGETGLSNINIRGSVGQASGNLAVLLGHGKTLSSAI